MMFTVYVLDFTKGNEAKEYIGRSSNFEKRLKRHLKELEDNKHHNEILQKWYNEGFRYNELPTLYPNLTLEEAKALEEKLIRKRIENRNIVNIECGGDTHSAHPRHAELAKAKSERQSAFLANLPAVDRALIYGSPGEKNGMYGKNHSPETIRLIKEKLRVWYQENESPNKGRVFTEEHRAKISHNASQRVGEKNPFYGKSHSKETREKLSKANKGRLPPNSKQVSVMGVPYDSLSAAARALKLNPSVVLWRLNSSNKRFVDWQWLDKCPTTRT
ncbi:GIY-YIG nuclease family protein [Salmonella enterica]|nr:GIY-YIG nuclease family protein [Salmonella enterica]